MIAIRAKSIGELEERLILLFIISREIFNRLEERSPNNDSVLAEVLLIKEDSSSSAS